MNKEKIINWLIKVLKADTNKISDGYHTFEELYEHRIWLYIKFLDELRLNSPKTYIWRSTRHSDGKLAFGGEWFVLGINHLAGKQITYHLPMKYWDWTEFAETREVAPEWDGHTPNDVLERLKDL